MIQLTGDTHVPYDIHRLSTKNFPLQKQMTKDDYLIICGDAGLVWDKSAESRYWIQWLEEKPFTTLFIDGNHENFDLLAQLPEIDYMGGRAHVVGKGIYHLMRGYVFNIDGHRIFTMGGASSHDIQYRLPGRDWWPEELPNTEEYARGRANLEACGWEVDYILSHCAPGDVQDRVCYALNRSFHYAKDDLTGYLQEIAYRCRFKKWYFGHYHTDLDVALDGAAVPNFRCIYNDILPIGE